MRPTPSHPASRPLASRPRALVGIVGIGAVASSLALLLGTGCERGAETTEPIEATDPPAPVDNSERARALAKSLIILDGHVDVPMRVEGALREGLPLPDIHDHTDEGNFDYVRAREGGLDAPFMSIYTPAALQAEPGRSRDFAEDRINYVLGLAIDHPERFALARTPAELRANFDAGLISLPMGMENGSPIEDELDNVRHFYERGIRYITLTHSEDNRICDSSYDDRHTHGGLSAFGREVVAEMNRLGVMVDVSHVSDDTFWQVMELSSVPVIASHSSCRHFTPGFERNMSDEMIAALADHGGVIQINFGKGFLDAAYREADEASRPEIRALLEAEGVEWWSARGRELVAAYRAEHPLPEVGVGVVADHIEHVIELAGVEHVGLGSDFDGVGDSLPTGLEDVSKYPKLIEVLLDRGHTDEAIEKICSGNVLRVWQAVEEHGASHRGAGGDPAAGGDAQ